MGRISLNTRFNNTERLLLDQTEELDEIRQTLASGKKVQNPSDDTTATVNINRFSNEIANLNQFADNATNAKNQLENSEAALQEVSSILQRSRELAVKANNDTLTEEDRNKIAQEVDERLEQMVNLANSQLGGDYLFAGAETSNQKPFEVRRSKQDEIVEVTYRGDFNPQEANTAEGQAVTKNLVGNNVFQATNQKVIGGFEFSNENDLQTSLDQLEDTQRITDGPKEEVQNSTVGGPGNTQAKDNTATVQVQNSDPFSAGDKVRVSDGTNSEVTFIDEISSGTEMELQLKNSYGANATVEALGADVETTTTASANDTSTTTLDVASGSDFEVGDKVEIKGNSLVSVRTDVPDPYGPVASSEKFEVGDTVRVTGLEAGTNNKVSEKTKIEEIINVPGNDDGQLVMDLENQYRFTGEEMKVNAVNKSEVESKSFSNLVGPEEVEVLGKPGANQIEVNLGQDRRFLDPASPTTDTDSANPTVRKTEEVSGPRGEGYFQVDGEKIYYDTSEDTIVDIAKRINERPIPTKAVFLGQPDASGDRKEYDPDEVLGAGDQPYQFTIRSTSPHEVYMKDFDRQPDNTPDQNEGLLNDLQLLGDGEGEPPAPRNTQDFPNPYNVETEIRGKSIFDAMIDLREGLQPISDRDGDSDQVPGEFAISKGNASRNRTLDPVRPNDVPKYSVGSNDREPFGGFSEKPLQESLSDFSGAIDNINTSRSIAGARLNRVESDESRIKDLQLSNKDLLSQFQDADLAQVITELRGQEAVQQAALRMTSRVLNQSLANFI